MTQIPYHTPGVHAFKDRSPRLLVMGILLIALGSICGCLGVFTPMALMMPRPPGMAPVRIVDVIAGILVYLVLAVVFVVVGVGSIRRRRWSRPVVLVMSWIWLIIGIAAMVFFLLILPDMPAIMQAGASGVTTTAPAGSPPGTVAPVPPVAMFKFFSAFMAVFMALVYVAIPAVLIGLYRGTDVQATLEFYDPNASWTDRCPLPVLGMAGLLALGGVWLLLVLPQGIFFIFGTVVTGTVARIAIVMMSVLFVAVAQRVYRLSITGWWMAVLLQALLALSAVLTFMKVDMLELYARIGMPQQQIDAIRRMRLFNNTVIIAWVIVAACVSIGYAIAVRRFFRTAPTPVAVES